MSIDWDLVGIWIWIFVGLIFLAIAFGVGLAIYSVYDYELATPLHGTIAVIIDKAHYTTGDDTRVGISTGGNAVVIPSSKQTYWEIAFRCEGTVYILNDRQVYYSVNIGDELKATLYESKYTQKLFCRLDQ